MKREWKPGDVALRVSPSGPSYVALRVAMCTATTSSLSDGPHWHFVSPSTPTPQCGSDRIAEYRPLMVIDPEDREQVERLHTLWCEAIVSKGTSSRQIDSMQAALREFANPRPVTVFEHFLDAQPVGDKGTARSICGKVWTPSKETESAGKCPVCVEMVDAGWVK